MDLNLKVLRSLVKEEIEKSLLTELKDEEEAAVTQIVSLLTRLDTEGMDSDTVLSQAQQQFKNAQNTASATGAANRKDVEEKLDKDATAGEYVKDFRDSDAPQFKGKSKKKKQQMAIAAYLDAKENK